MSLCKIAEISAENLPTISRPQQVPVDKRGSILAASCFKLHHSYRDTWYENNFIPQVGKTPDSQENRMKCHKTALYMIIFLQILLCCAKCGGCRDQEGNILSAIDSVFVENSGRFFSLTHCNHRSHSQTCFNSQVSLSVKSYSSDFSRSCYISDFIDSC